MPKVFIDKDTGQEFEAFDLELNDNHWLIIDPLKPKQLKKTRYRICMWPDNSPESEVFEIFVDATKPETKSINKAVEAVIDYVQDGVPHEPKSDDPYVILARKLVEANQ